MSDEHYGPGRPINANDLADIIAERDRLRAVLCKLATATALNAEDREAYDRALRDHASSTGEDT